MWLVLLIALLFACSTSEHLNGSENHSLILVIIPSEDIIKREIIRRTWLNISDSKSPNDIAVRFLVDTKPPASESNETDLIITPDRFKYFTPGVHAFMFPKMRSAVRAAFSMSFSFVLWCDDDAVLNMRWFISHLRRLHHHSPVYPGHKSNATRLYMGYPQYNNVNNAEWDPDYAERIRLPNYPTYMHGSFIVFGSSLFKAFAAMDEEVGLHYYGFGDVSFGMWAAGLDAEYVPFTEPVTLFPNLEAIPPQPSLCSEYIVIHNIKNAADLEKYGDLMRHCHEDKTYHRHLKHRQL